jgi:Rieske Fe-S protein
MKRRDFIQGCAAGLLPWCVDGVAADGTTPAVKPYARAALVDGDGAPLKASRLAVNRNYLFNFPYASTPCFLLALDRATARSELVDAGGRRYAWEGGVGPRKAIVAYSAICAHKLAYPAREVSFIRFQESPSSTSPGGVIHCCAEHSVYDPSAGARVVSGPAPQPLAAIALEYDPKTDQLAAVGTIGAEQFDAFFQKYAFKLGLDYGDPVRARAAVGPTTACREMSQVCRQTIQC